MDKASTSGFNLRHFLANNLGHEIAIAATLVLTLLALYPNVIYLWRGWDFKKREIVNSFSLDAVRLYLKNFQKKDLQGEEAARAFDKIYNHNYGRYRFAFPLLVFAVVCAGGVFFSCEWAVTKMIVLEGGKQTAFALKQAGFAGYVTLPAAGAIAEIGAYVWIVSDLFSRAQRQDFQPTDVLNSALRLALSAPIGYAFSAIGGGGLLALPLAFSAGAFPLSTVRVMLRRFATEKLGLGVGIADDDDQVIEINCVDHPTADILLDTGISTVSQLAYCDPVQLCMRTGLKFDYIVDIVSQALAWLYFEDKLDKLRAAGLRGAIELGNLLDDAGGDPSEAETRRALALCDIAANMVDLSTPAFLNACDQTAEDSAALFLTAVWRASMPDAQPVSVGATSS